MNRDFRAGADTLEEQLRAAAPTLPPAARGRTLARCAVEAECRRRRGRGHVWLRWAFVGTCALHWASSAVLDSQRAALMAGAPIVQGSPAGPLLAASSSPIEVRSMMLARSRMLRPIMDHDAATSSVEAG